ncbi:MAG TPA: hypothetical protein DCL60_04020 [Armatimonadetes bacterium]|mgnify:CR=1 FL=1|nr:hypothetical protein [Armatimonadota bacterium]
MLIDLRLHLITLVAVFLALAVGIAVGSTFLAGSSVERQVARGLEREFGKLRKENETQKAAISEITERLKQTSEFGDIAVPVIVQGRLSHRRMAIIQTGDYPEAVQNAVSALEYAGAQVVSITTISNIESADFNDRVLQAAKNISGGKAKDPQSVILKAVAESIALSPDEGYMGMLEQKGIISRSGFYLRRAGSIVLVGGSKEGGSRRTNLLLVEKLKAAGATNIVGVEQCDAAVSYIVDYQREGISTVDHIDLPMGQVSLVFAMSGEAGNYGVRRSADRLLPAYLESAEWQKTFR